MSAIGFLVFILLLVAAWFLVPRFASKSSKKAEDEGATAEAPPVRMTPAATSTSSPSTVMPRPREAAPGETPPPATTPPVELWTPAVRESLAADRIDSLRSLVAGFPDLPVGTRQILVALQDPNTPPQQIARLIGTDPALAARILRVVNWSFFNLPNKISDLSRAIVLLGNTQVRNLVLQGGIGQVLVARDGKARVDLSGFWYHSFCTATCAFHFARKTGTVSPGQASTVGLLHDLGKAVWWWAHAGTELAHIPGRGLSTLESLKEEETRCGVNHQSLGALLAVQWGLPVEVVQGIEYHHHPAFVSPELLPREVRDLAGVLWMADKFAHRFALFVGDEKNPQAAAEAGIPGDPQDLSVAWNASPLTTLVDPELHKELLRARALAEHPDHEPVTL